MVNLHNEHRKWAKLVLESIDDYDALMANPAWLVDDKTKKATTLLGTLQSRLTNFKRTLE